MGVIRLDHIVHRQCQEVFVNTDDISTFGTTYTYGTDYYLKMKNGSTYWLTEESYKKLKDCVAPIARPRKGETSTIPKSRLG